MPLHKTITVSPSTKVLIWKIEETEEELRKGVDLIPESKQRLQGMKSEIHRRGFLSVRHLLEESGYAPSQLYYDSFGKPHLSDGVHISITHSFIFSGIIVSNKEVGIDIELRRDKVQKIAHKFVDYEFTYLSEPQLTKKLTKIWCAKESVYKAFATKGVSFRQHTRVLPFTMEEEKTKAWVFYGRRASSYNIEFFELEQYNCAYALKM